VTARIPLRERTRRSIIVIHPPSSVMATIPRHRRPDPYGLAEGTRDQVNPPIALQ
jgi:hypothetical protein